MTIVGRLAAAALVLALAPVSVFAAGLEHDAIVTTPIGYRVYFGVTQQTLYAVQRVAMSADGAAIVEFIV